jgi:pimeloyl-ACP methyl ester carboxylesterase
MRTLTTRTTLYTHDTVPTTYVETDGVRFAYRRFGRTGKTPVVFIQHFRGTMDNHDPAITDQLADEREIILFDNRGVGSTNGIARETVDDMARDTASFIDALGLSTVDLLGHSMGGEVAQMLALARPELVRAPISAETALAHGTAARVFGRPSTDGYADLRRIARPTLVVNGSDDIVIPTVNSFILQQHIPNAKLVLYPDSNHGAHYQFHEDFVAQVKLFLDGPAESL